MKLLRMSDVPPSGGGEVRFGEAYFLRMVVGLALLAAGLGIPFALIAYGSPGLVGFLMLVAVWVPIFFFISVKFMYSVWASIRPGNWLLRVRPEGLLVNLRSYLDTAGGSGDRVILSLSYDEIDWVRKHSRKVSIPAVGSNGHRTAIESFLDLKLSEADLTKLEETIAAETAGRPVGVILEPGVLSLHWRGEYSWVTPDLGKALEILGERAAITKEQAAGGVYGKQLALVRRLLALGFSFIFILGFYIQFMPEIINAWKKFGPSQVASLIR